MADFLIRSDSSGIMHYTNALIPSWGDFNVSLTVSTNSIWMCLSDLVLFGSLNPGVSTNVIFPKEAILTKEVTASKDLDASKEIFEPDILV